MYAARRSTTWLAAALVPAAAFAPAPAGAQPACAAGTAADYFALGAQGCTLGGVTFGEFAPVLPWQNFDGGRLTLTPVTRARSGRAYVGFRLAIAPQLSVSSAAALAVDRCESVGAFCYSDDVEYEISLAASGAPLGIFATANIVGSATSSGTWLAGAGAELQAPRESDDGDQQALGVIHGFASEAGQDFGARCRIPFANDNEFGGPTSTPAQFCPTDIVARPPNGRYEASLRAYVYSVTFDGPPAGGATATVVSADMLFDVGPATTVPEPASVALLAPALLTVGYVARRRRVPAN